MFCEEASKIKDKVPASSKYQSMIDWSKDPESRTIRFTKSKRETVADVITKKGEKKEKSTPGPAGHDQYEAWKKTLGKVSGTLKIKEKRISFVQESSSLAN